MVRGGVGLMKLKCGEAAKRSATSLPISRGEPPRGQLLKSDCAAAPGVREAARDAASATAQAARNERLLIDCSPSVRAWRRTKCRLRAGARVRLFECRPA